jgi:hypothetical protein
MVKQFLMQNQGSKIDKSIGNFYSRVEVFCVSSLNLTGFIREKCFDIKNNIDYNQKKEYDVFAKEFSDCQSTLNCIYEIETVWKKSQEGQNKPEYCTPSGASIMVYNQWELDLYIGIYDDKWFLSSLSEYTNEWKKNYAENVKNKSGGSVILYIPFYQDIDADEFISKERVCALLKEWLETSEYAVDFDGNEKITYMKKILNESETEP